MNIKCLNCQNNVNIIILSQQFSIKCCDIEYIYQNVKDIVGYVKVKIDKKYFSNKKVQIYCSIYFDKNEYLITYRLKTGQKFTNFKDNLENLTIEKINSIIENDIFK